MSTESENKSQFHQIEERCQNANIEIIRVNKEDIDKGFWIKIKSGEGIIQIPIFGESKAELLLQDDIHFEKISGINGYHAYYSIEHKYIEAMLECEYGGMPLGHYSLYERSIKPKLNNQEENSRIVIKIKNDQYHNIKLSVGISSPTFSVLETLREYIFQGQRIDYTTIRIEQVEISSHEEALEILDKFSASLLFELTYITGLPILLAARTEYSRNIEFLSENKHELSIARQYDKEPMSLYLYASTASIMPLVQYLAYYQVVEFYFPKFKKEEAVNIINQTLENPLFDTDRYTQMQNLINKLNPLIAKNEYANEIYALRATIKNCVQPEEIKSFLEEREERKKFFNSYNKWKDITDKPSPLREQGDIVNDTANRIYAIRCKIVHTKNTESINSDSTNNETKFILPFSEESQKLGYDIELVQFIARKVLIACSKHLYI
ncbi:hypothetical protein [Anabaena sp. CA = ATCC 33047]|uniref:hypothetical protein n=1 Tax=Anabaena sp. (strain CA / ATCC 33047) TaxID=52271 RepID=UPI000834B1D8|nr:hypothetical protein [Anabaena sp. CA = ATCC 33047]